MTVTLDTSAVFAIINRADTQRDRMLHARAAERAPYIIPAGILAELTYMFEATLPLQALVGLFSDLQSGAYSLEHDFGRIKELVHRFADLRLGFADAAVIACGERHAGRVLTLDHRRFGVAAKGEVTITLLT